MKYNIIRKHSEDTAAHIVETAETKKAAREIIKTATREIAARSACETKIKKLDDNTLVKFIGTTIEWSIGYWIEKAE